MCDNNDLKLDELLHNIHSVTFSERGTSCIGLPHDVVKCVDLPLDELFLDVGLRLFQSVRR